MIYDRKGEEVRGMATLMTKFFFIKGNASSLANELEGNIILIQKKNK
ncbi:hypothetical protein K8R43_04120 [archaeon]|nr:hypothetical protein [archaeon]